MLISVKAAPERSSARLRSRIEATLRYRLARFSKAVARVEVHVCDLVRESRPWKERCTIEIELNERGAIAIAQDGLIFEHALSGAAAKSVAALDRILGKTGSGRTV